MLASPTLLPVTGQHCQRPRSERLVVSTNHFSSKGNGHAKSGEDEHLCAWHGIVIQVWFPYNK